MREQSHNSKEITLLLLMILSTAKALTYDNSTLYFSGENTNLKNSNEVSGEYWFYKGVSHLFGVNDSSLNKIDLTKAFVYLSIGAKKGDLNAAFYLEFMRYYKLGESRFFKNYKDLKKYSNVNKFSNIIRCFYFVF
jgi:TPR repeat protein